MLVRFPKGLRKELFLRKAIKEQCVKKISLLAQCPGVHITTVKHVVTHCSLCPTEMPLYNVNI